MVGLGVVFSCLEHLVFVSGSIATQNEICLFDLASTKVEAVDQSGFCSAVAGRLTMLFVMIVFIGTPSRSMRQSDVQQRNRRNDSGIKKT